MELPINKRDIAIPEAVIKKWQSAVNTIAEVVKVPVALITKVEPPHRKVFCSNESSNNPFPAGSKELLAGLYCGTVVANKRQLLVTNALKDGGWKRNPAIKLGFISYLGFPLFWPDGEIFGTLAVFDTRENDYGGSPEKLMSQFNDLIESHLSQLFQNRRLELILESLGDIKEGFQPIAEPTKDAIITTNHQGTITFWNQAAELLFGYSAAEARGKPLTSIMPERFHKAYRDEIKQAVSSAESNLERKVTQMAGLRKDGLEFPLELTHTPWKTSEGTFFTAVVRVTTERKRVGEMLQQRNKELTALNSIAQSISQSMELDEVLQRALDGVLEAVDLSVGGIYLRDETTGEPVLVANKGLGEDLIDAIKGMPPGVVSARRMKDKTEIDTVSDLPAGEPKGARPEPPVNSGEIQYVLTLPLRSRGNDLGAIVLVTQSQHGFTTGHIQLLETISNQVGVAVDNARLFEKTSRLSITDELTGLYNHRHFSELLQAEIARTERYGDSLSLIMLDLDGFKEYNDRFGHVSGDTALKVFGQTLRSALRKTDLTFRYGGDEFAIILPAADAARARNAVERVKSKWLQTVKEQRQIIQTFLGFSAGIAQFPENAETADVLTLLADTALYYSKRQGRYICTLVSEMGIIEADIQSPTTLDQVQALLSTADARSPQTYDHSRRVAAISEIIGKSLGLPEAELAELNVAALLHDTGKVAIEESILNKTGELTEDEWLVIRKHPAEGARIAACVPGATAAIPIIRHHHERYDGTGYPEGLKSEAIPLGARIVAVADAYSTMTAGRPDKSAISDEEALEELKRHSGTQFDPHLVQVFGETTNQATRQG